MTTRIAIAGAGLIGRRHADLIQQNADTVLAGIADPAPAAKALAEALDVPHQDSLADLLRLTRADGVIIATPNQMHLDNALCAIEAGKPALIEKPLADTTAAARQIMEASERTDVPLLVGHHRRHNPLIQEAKARIDAGELGRIVAVHAQFWLFKPDDYFNAGWRREPGAGPVLINLIHDVDLLRYLCGEIVSVQAIESNATRGFAVEDTSAALIRFRNGALGTLTASDSIVAPWSWELTAAENPAYPPTDQFCYLIGGTHGSLSLPQNTLWQAAGPRSWWSPITAQTTTASRDDPLVRQLAHFVDVIHRRTPPLVPASEGLASLKVIAALKQAARDERPVACM